MVSDRSSCQDRTCHGKTDTGTDGFAQGICAIDDNGYAAFSGKNLIETSLHQQLKQLYAENESCCEQQLGQFRIDVVQGEELIEIQCSSLAALRDKVRQLTPQHKLRIIKPVIRKTRIIRKKWSQVLSSRLSPRTGDWLDLFEEFVHFVTVFPRENLTVEILLIDIEEVRRPPRGRGRSRGYRIEDRRLLEVVGSTRLQEPQDLFSLLPAELPEQFNTAELAEIVSCPRWVAQKVAYCLKHTGAAIPLGKQGNAVIYQRAGRNVQQKAA